MYILWLVLLSPINRALGWMTSTSEGCVEKLGVANFEYMYRCIHYFVKEPLKSFLPR